mmetsp:Transcript_9766/g.36402  ORF Transcript_9766/g.36402 Transcript_9766/m.36402 type:complete len:211 (+) Transcript_9766:2-634(+)
MVPPNSYAFLTTHHTKSSLRPPIGVFFFFFFSLSLSYKIHSSPHFELISARARSDSLVRSLRHYLLATSSPSIDAYNLKLFVCLSFLSSFLPPFKSKPNRVLVCATHQTVFNISCRFVFISQFSGVDQIIIIREIVNHSWDSQHQTLPQDPLQLCVILMRSNATEIHRHPSHPPLLVIPSIELPCWPHPPLPTRMHPALPRSKPNFLSHF